MKKLKISLKINDFLINTNGTMTKNNIVFKNDGIEYTFNLHHPQLLKEDKTSLVCLDFDKEKPYAAYFLKEYLKEIKVNLVIKELKIEKNEVIIRYEIEKESFCLQLFYEEE